MADKHQPVPLSIRQERYNVSDLLPTGHQQGDQKPEYLPISPQYNSTTTMHLDRLNHTSHCRHGQASLG